MAISEYEKCTLNSNKAILLLTVTDSSQKTNKKVWFGLVATQSRRKCARQNRGRQNGGAKTVAPTQALVSLSLPPLHSYHHHLWRISSNTSQPSRSPRLLFFHHSRRRPQPAELLSVLHDFHLRQGGRSSHSLEQGTLLCASHCGSLFCFLLNCCAV